MIAAPTARQTPRTLPDAGTPIYDELLAEHPGVFDRAAPAQPADEHDDPTAELPAVTDAAAPVEPAAVEADVDTVEFTRTRTSPWFTPRGFTGQAAA
ncbi:hypothetical protein [Nonomuraea dietziae]|uniref:hypothetical protein n=1 Tax=Nonomuraea dietziae TaxID=65515 RepID=UPI0033EAEFC4